MRQQVHFSGKKIWIILKNSLNKSCTELNFLQKNQWNHIFTCPRSEARGLQRFAFLEYYNALHDWREIQKKRSTEQKTGIVPIFVRLEKN